MQRAYGENQFAPKCTAGSESVCTAKKSIYEASWRYLEWFESYRADSFVTETATYKVQRGITLKIYIQELWFLRSAHRLILVEDLLNGFQVAEQTRFCHWNCYLQFNRHNSKIYISELRVLCSAHRLMLVNISMKFHEILNGFQVAE